MEDRFQPGKKLGISALLTQQQLIAEVTPRVLSGIFRGHPAPDQVFNSRLDVELQFGVQVAIQTVTAEDVAEA